MCENSSLTGCHPRVYETYYLETFLADYSPSTVAWIGSIQAFAQFSATLLSGPLSDRYGPLVFLVSSPPFHQN